MPAPPLPVATAPVGAAGHGRRPSLSLGPTVGHSRRLSTVSRANIDDAIAPPSLSAFEAAAHLPVGSDAATAGDEEAAGAAAGAPPFLRGHVLRLWMLKRRCFDAVTRSIERDGGVRDEFGFQRGNEGAARCAVETLVADLSGAGGPEVPSLDDAVARLHSDAFENFGLWAAMVGAKPLPDAVASPEQRLRELSVLYCVRAEAANLRFCPELLCWLVHQMLRRFRPPPPAAIVADADPESSFFARVTVLPLYEVLKRNARALPAPVAGAGSLCGAQGAPPALRNSDRPNYDDFNEKFWTPACLDWSYHTLDAKCIGVVAKTFRERASWAAVLLAFFRWFAFQAVLLHALYLVAWDIVAAGGLNLSGLGLIDVAQTAISATGCFETLAIMQLLRVMLVAAQAAPPASGGRFFADVAPLVTPRAVARLVYALVWAGVIIVVANSALLLGTDLSRGPIWLGIVCARLLCILVGEGLLAPLCRCGGDTSAGATAVGAHAQRLWPLAWLSEGCAEVLRDLETAQASPQWPAVMGPRHMREPARRVLEYSFFWAIVLAIKTTFDLHVITQQVRLVLTLQQAQLTYAPAFVFDVFGLHNGLIVFGSWLVLVTLVAVDSYVAFVLVAPLVGYYVCAKDGLGALKHGGTSAVKRSFLSGLSTSAPSPARGSGFSRGRTPLAEQFVAKCIPLAAARGVDAHFVFRRVWDQFVMALRASDLVSNEEQCRLLYGDGVLGLENQLPLFLYAGKLRRLALAADRLLIYAHSARSDDELAELAFAGDESAAEAAKEVLSALPHVIAHVCKSHSAIGWADDHVGATVLSLFVPHVERGEGARHAIARALSGNAEGGGGGGEPRAVAREVLGLVARLMVEFEHSGASTRLRRAPLLALTRQLLTRLHNLRCDAGDTIGPAREPSPVREPTFCGMLLKCVGLAPRLSPSQPATVTTAAPPATRAGGQPSFGVALTLDTIVERAAAPERARDGSASGAADTRSVRGLVALLSRPNEASGRLDADGDFGATERLESLLECARRVFYLLTMDVANGELAVPEAERRVIWFINSLFMPQMLPSASVLHSPSVSTVTPHYGKFASCTPRLTNSN